MIFSIQRYLEDLFESSGLRDADQYAINCANVYYRTRQKSAEDRLGVIYWKLYAVENTIRIVIHSVLTAQIGPTWWDDATDTKIKNNARFRANYAPQNASPGSHDIYLVSLNDLTKILRANNHLLAPVIRDTDYWIATLEGILAPRNLVGHMNFPNAYDRLQVNNAYTQLPDLIGQLTASNVPILNPT